MGRVIFIILFLSSIQSFAQQTLSFKTVDTTTYQQYLRGDWKELIQSGKEALDQDINYYYLQMRIAYAHFSRQDYRSAIKYYKNALEFNKKDPVANEYLYYSYLYSGRYNDALLRIESLTPAQKRALKISDDVSFVSFGMNYSYASSNASTVSDDIISGLAGEYINGVQKTTNYFNVPQIAYSHRFGRNVILNHSLSYLSKNEFSYTINTGTHYISPEQIAKQYEYGLSIEITPAEGWLIKPGINFVNLRVPLFDVANYGTGAGADRWVAAYLNIKNRTYSLQVSKEFQYFNLGTSYAYNKFNNINTHQLGLHSTIYPLANLNLYYSVDLYLQQLNYNTATSNNYILNQLLGFKIHNNFWLELSGKIPQHMNLYDIRNNVSYNNIEMIDKSWNVKGIVPVYKANMKIFASFGQGYNSSYFFPDAAILNPINKQSYHNYIITGGIKWTK